jgi:hypothetical protein
MAYKVFTNGSTLQASELNENLMQQSIAVFSNAAARTAAITSPVEGQMTYLEDTNGYSTWSGSAWVSSAIGIGSGLVHLTTQTIGSGVSSVAVSNVFSSAYDNYKVIVSGSNASVGGASMRMTMNSSAGSTYFWAGQIQIYDGSNVFAGSNNTTSFQVMNMGSVSTTNLIIEFFNPFAATATTFKSQFAARSDVGQYGGVDSNAVSQTGFTLLMGAGTLTGGSVNVYGYRRN